MNLNDAQNILAVRLYEWAQRDLYREFETGCPLLSLIGQNNRTIGGIVSWNKGLSSAERRFLANARPRINNHVGREMKKETVSAEDQYWSNLCHDSMKIHRDAIPGLATAFRDSPTYEPLDAELCLDTLAASAPLALGKATRYKWGVRCIRPFGEWKVFTEYTLVRSQEELYSVYQFIRKDDKARLRPCVHWGRPYPRDLLSLYGLSPTLVNVPSRIDGELMAKTLPKLDEHFVSQAGVFFDGIGIGD